MCIVEIPGYFRLTEDFQMKHMQVVERMKRKIYFFILSVSLLSSSAFAVDSLLTLKTVVDLAVKQGTRPKQSLNQLEQKQLAVEQSSSELLPSVNSSISGGTNGKLTSKPWTVSSSVSAGVSYSLTPSSFLSLEAARLKQNAAQYDYKQTVNDITGDAVQQYMRALYAMKKVSFAQNNLNNQKEKLLQIEEFRVAGKKTIADVLQQQTSVAEAEATLVENQQGYGLIVLNLCNISGLPFDGSTTIDTTVLSRISNNLTGYNFIDQGIDYDTIPKIKSQELMVQAAEKSVREAELSYFPSLSTSVNVGSSWESTVGGTTSGGGGKSGGNSPDESWSDPTARISLGLSYLIFDKHKRRQRKSSSLLSLQNAKIQLKAEQRDVSLEYHKTLYDIESAKKKLEVTDVRLNASKQSLDAVTERYNAGVSTLIEVSSVNNSYLNAVNSRLQAETDMLLAQLDLLKQSGQIYTFIQNLFSSK